MRRGLWTAAALAVVTSGAWADDRPVGQSAPAATAERDLTLGLAQLTLRVGLSGAELAERLGSPNIVTRDSEGRESWIYDRIATETTWSGSAHGIGGGALGSGAWSGGGILGLLGGQLSKRSGSRKTTERTLTVVVKLDPAGTVESFSFHASRF
jgi:hypothetical protein